MTATATGDISSRLVKAQDGSERVLIDRADPFVLITDEFMVGYDERYVQVDCAENGNPQAVTLWDDFDHRFIYRVVSYDFPRNLWLCEWPD